MIWGRLRSRCTFGVICLTLAVTPAANGALLPGSTFEIDGNTAAGPGSDWSSPGTFTVASATDPLSGTPDGTTFPANTTEGNPTPSLVTGTVARKFDLTSFRATSQTVRTGGSTHTQFFLAWERDADGQALVDVELRQGAGRRLGDLLLVTGVANQGTLNVYRWAAAGSSGCASPTSPPGQAPRCWKSVPIPAGAGLVALGPGRTFGEAGLDLTAIEAVTPGGCESFVSASAKTNQVPGQLPLGGQLQDAAGPLDLVVESCPNLKLTKTDGDASTVPGAAIAYTLTVSNQSTVPVVGARVTDVLPPAIVTPTWQCGLPAAGAVCRTGAGTGNVDALVDLPAGASLVVTVSGSVSAAAVGETDIVNSATVALPDGVIDTKPSNNTAVTTNRAIKIVSITSISVGCQPIFDRSSKLVLTPAAAIAITRHPLDTSAAHWAAVGGNAPMLLNTTSAMKYSRKFGIN